MPGQDLPATPADTSGGRPTDRGALISIEGLNGVGKTYLTDRVLDAIPASRRPSTVAEFSRRQCPDDQGSGYDLGRQLLRSLVNAAAGEPFLRSGSPRSETLLLLAIKAHDFETSRATLQSGGTVIEGRSLHSVAVYQSLILGPGTVPETRDIADVDIDAVPDAVPDVVRTEDEAMARARTILFTAAAWRPLPDLTVLITDDPDTAVGRAEARDDFRYTPEQWRLHRRAAALFDRLAADDPRHVWVLDRRGQDAESLTATLLAWIESAPRRSWAGSAR
ncbi:dTMP kinase [Pseudonocardia sp. HH130630-07]|uniref:dTMP kinase n=1 Tax=Pseudonocardia sp. HH130630-07 TaxID=1690815 RepID=UPI000814D20C|nr:hypothetical protein [Pseudonocardia sp. HH130630-07]ANY07784.1 hypothetical protein AFB00_17445 [Pseudonocardia sp. HH130630-07]